MTMDLDAIEQRANIRKLNADAATMEYHLTLRHAADVGRVYRFHDPIMDSTVDTCVEVLDKWANLSGDPITLAFNSPGGSIFSGFGLFDFLTELARTHDLETTVYGYAASMAAILVQAGTVRTMRPNAYFMVHEASSMQQGSMANLRDQMELLEQMQERTIDILANRSGTSRDVIEEKTNRKDWWLTAEEALSYGFIDEIV